MLLDQIEMNEALGRPDLEVEVSEEVHAHQSIDVPPEREHRDREVGRVELGHVDQPRSSPTAVATVASL